MSYEKGPPENTLTLNATHQMLSHFESRGSANFQYLVAFSPTRKWENLRGYDISMSFLKTTVFQYKRPKVPDNSTPRCKQYRRFQLSRSQWLTLLLIFEPGEAFFTLPEVMTESQLAKSKKRTVFVDVYGILPNTSLAYVPPKPTAGNACDFLLGKIKKDQKYPIHPDYVYSWEELSNGIDDCHIGFRIGTPEERPEEFQRFENRVENVNDLAEKEQWKQRLKRIIQRQHKDYKDFYTEITEYSDQYPSGNIYSIKPLESITWKDIVDIIPSDKDTIDEEVDSLINTEWTMRRIQKRIQKLEEKDIDLSTYSLKSSKVNVFGR